MELLDLAWEVNTVIKSLDHVADFMIERNYLGLVVGSLGEVKNHIGFE
tara:strand:+ start:609 stop:752 length:144 start_codon:yes stop_codon:yes gene_type:complete